ncbi:MAG: hypothetical protein WCL70_11690 [Paludibacter sp.]
MKTKYKIIPLLFHWLFVGCDLADNKLLIINKSDSNIYIDYSCDSILTNVDFIKNGFYFDSIKNDSIYVEESLYIKANSSKHIIERGFNEWSRKLEKCNGNLYLFVFSDSIVNSRSL